MRFGDYVYVVSQTCLRQHFTQTGCKLFGVSLNREEYDRVLLFGVCSVLLKKLQQLSQECSLVFGSLRFGGMLSPQLKR